MFRIKITRYFTQYTILCKKSIVNLTERWPLKFWFWEAIFRVFKILQSQKRIRPSHLPVLLDFFTKKG